MQLQVGEVERRAAFGPDAEPQAATGTVEVGLAPLAIAIEVDHERQPALLVVPQADDAVVVRGERLGLVVAVEAEAGVEPDRHAALDPLGHEGTGPVPEPLGEGGVVEDEPGIVPHLGGQHVAHGGGLVADRLAPIDQALALLAGEEAPDHEDILPIQRFLLHDQSPVQRARAEAGHPDAGCIGRGGSRTMMSTPSPSTS